MNAVVFLGPSLDLDAARDILPAEYRPPITRGDLDRLLARDHPPDAVGIVDGRFPHVPGVTPTEVLRALDAGVTVYGSSGVGALRAAECAPFGMVGVGAVFEAYASGRVEADDEVAAAPGADGRLIDWRLGLADGPAGAARFLELADQTYFAERTLDRVLDLLAAETGAEVAAHLGDLIRHKIPDAGRDDAIALLRVMAGDAG